jgi:hypothetical protein
MGADAARQRENNGGTIMNIAGKAGAVILAALFTQGAEAQKVEKSVLKNNFVSAQVPISTGPNFGFVSVNKGNGPDGKPISVITIDLCSYHPDFEHRYCLFASGYAPPDAVSSSGTQSVTVELANISILQGGIVDCRTGGCMGPFPVPAESLKGIWNRYEGPFSFDFESTGVTRSEGRFPENTLKSIRTGRENNYSAALRGSLGTTALETPGMFGSATINFSSGTSIEITRTTNR